ncbi:MAG: DUF5665 domain-containing protein [Bacillota bacterium]
MKDKDLNKKILNKLDELNKRMQKYSLAEYQEMFDNPWKMILTNFVAGLARGLGIAIGATILGAIFLLLLFRLGSLNLPVIGKFIARLIKIVEMYL